MSLLIRLQRTTWGSSFLRKQFRSWYAEQVRRQLEDGKEPEKAPSAKWIVSMYDYLWSRPEIIINGFKKAGIIQAIKEGPDKEVPLEFESDDDPFADLSEWCQVLCCIACIVLLYSYIHYEKLSKTQSLKHNSKQILLLAIFNLRNVFMIYGTSIYVIWSLPPPLNFG